VERKRGEFRYRQSAYQNQLDWVIAGGMTGPDAAPLHPDWVRSLRDQCQVAGVPFFFKQWGDVVYVGNANASGYHLKRIGNKAAGRGLDGQLWDQVPEALEGR
jgi:protein gp37